jgi:soluble lytic murein transglycosylase-like protein
VLLTGAQAQEIATPLGQDDVARYARIFELQEDGKWQAADAEIARLNDKLLLGHVLHQRYMHPTAYRSSYAELKRWLTQYADHPNADVIYKLARKRKPSGASNPRRYQTRRWRTNDPSWLHPQLEADYKAARNPAEVRRIENYIRYLNKEDRPTQALNYINERRYRSQLSQAQYDRIRSWIAASYFYNGKSAKARSIASSVAARNGDVAVLAYWIAGLSAFRDGEMQDAADYFSRMAAVEYQEPALRSAAGFWAARAALASGQARNVTHNLQIAAQFPHTFYGQLALGQLGQEARFNWQAPQLTNGDWAALSNKSKRVRRAAALAQVGQETLAHTEMRWAHGELESADDAALMATAFDLDLWAAQIHMAIASNAYAPEKNYLAAGLYPLPDYAPAGGFTLDKAVLFGLIRQESKFKTEAKSRVGAAGLMQLMPRTAAYVGRDRSLQYRSQSDRLYEPAYNMQLGQSYVEYLLNGQAKGDMFEMALSYNWGPGNLRRFKNKTGITDQLLLLESIPNPEARNFVEHVMTNIWVYRAQLGEEAPTRDAAAAGLRPIYRSVSVK